MSSASVIDQLRKIPLESILAYHGLVPKPDSKKTTRYKNDEFNIVVSEGGLWYDNEKSVGGRGAIDLVLRVKYRANPRTASSEDISKAVRWLATFQPGAFVASANSPSASSPRLPKESFASQANRLAIRDDARWPLVRNYLLQTRRLPSDLVDHLHQAGHIYATFGRKRPEHTGVCFVHRNLNDDACGATIRSIGSASTFSIGEKRAAWFAVGERVLARRAILVEAPIDAISYAALKRPEETIIVSVSGSHATQPLLDAAHAHRWELAIGFDNDGPGNAGWEHCREDYALLYPDDQQPSRALPVGKDWNDDLRVAPRRSHGTHL